MSPGPISGQVSACNCGDRRMGVFARGPGGDLLHSWWDGQGWNVFESLGMPRSPSTGAWIPFTGISLACAWEKFRLDVFARAADGKLYSASSNGSWHQAGLSPESGSRTDL